MISEKEIENLCNTFLADNTTLFLVDVKVNIGNKISIRIDSDESVLVTDCKALSRFVEENLDREKEDFALEVSSAGIDFPLKSLRQLTKNIGRSVHVVLTDGGEIKGKLLAANETEIEVDAEIKEKNKKIKLMQTTVATSKIKETKIIISFM